MNRIFVSVAAALMMSSAAIAGENDKNAWYVSGEAGANWLETDFSTPSGGITVEHETGWAGIGAIGYKWSNNWRLELEGSYRKNDADEYSSSPGTAINGDTTQTSLIANVVYDWDFAPKWELSGGAGVGWTWFDLDHSTTLPVYSTSDDDALALQLLAGLSYQVAPQLELVGNYRFMTSREGELTGTFGTPVDELENENHTLSVGLRWTFAPPPAVVQQAAAPAPAPVVCQKQSFLVFFDFDQAALTADAEGIVASAVDAYNKGCTVVLAVGHTDTVGSQAYNQRLSERRAAAVKSSMESRGVPGDRIATEGKSFNDPLVATGPGVKEAQNRRVVITVE